MGVLVKVGFAQINPTVGDFSGNAAKILEAYERLSAAGAEVVLTPELALAGYPPQDLLLKSSFVERGVETLEKLASAVGPVPLVVGFVSRNTLSVGRPLHNSAAVIENGTVTHVINKTLLPTYDVFDEARYFEPAPENLPVNLGGIKAGITICEDIWTPDQLPCPLYTASPVEKLVKTGATVILNLSASPFHLGKPDSRAGMISRLSREHGVPIAYCNAVGGNDQLVFDGNSLAVSPSGLLWRGVAFKEAEAVVDLEGPGMKTPPPQDEEEELLAALVLGLRDYLLKCGFKSCVLGLSGGIDSALTAFLAAEAVGARNVTGVLMPSPFSSTHSVEDARALAQNLGIHALEIPIAATFDAVKAQMAPVFSGRPEDATEENMQARLRGLTLMALSNKFGSLLLTTGNKSELAVGYCTLYGDMCGGLAAISDVPKTMVYRLAEHINRRKEVIPRRTIEKPPSAELRPDQTDQDTLPPYDILDGILRLYVEDNCPVDEIASRGFDPETVRWVARRVDLNEYKREQAAPGIKVTARAFGLGRRMPIAQRFTG